MTHRRCFALDLVADADLVAAYEAAHAPGAVWPQVIAGIRASGVLDMEIWRTADRLFMIAEVEADYPRPIAPELAAVDAHWQAAMDRFQRRLSSAGDEKWAPMTRIFALAEQVGASPEGNTK
ncbi:L-rhamnose mutarotase [Sphingomonas yantingensis]|uniref:L-rhamnose mutarotase n=1 Tax=Sphingomonas yantingensis TaxID=1241761 RepID=A0A7W9APK6_9SPHN|nr:L-rhamnose mutarotase [Sphingomonas yantingensis]MBB5698121.1 L-rhamnose mutarotase [Sphingomonas yantingensis]